MWEILIALVGIAVGVVIGRLTAPRGGPLQVSPPTPSGPPHKQLFMAQEVWFPWRGEWKRGRIQHPAEPTRRYYTVRCYDTGVPVNRDIRVAHPDLRLTGDGPLNEMCPPMSIVELEQEMGKEA